MPPTWEKGSHLPSGNTKLGNLRDGHNSVTAPTAKPDLGFSSSMLGECWMVYVHPGTPEMWWMVHRYTRWTGRLSHQTSNLSHPCNPLLKGCDLCFTQYWVQGDAGSDLPGWHQTTKVILTKSSTKRSGYMHMDKYNTQLILVMLCSMRGTKIARVEGLWLVNRPKYSISEYPDDSPKVWVCSPFIVPSLNSMRDHCDIISWCHNHLLWSSCGKTTVHVHQKHCSSSSHLPASMPESPITIIASKPLCLFLNLNCMPVIYIYIKFNLVIVTKWPFTRKKC